MIEGSEIATEAARRVLERARGSGRPALEIVAESVFHERERLARHSTAPWAAEDRAFVDGVAKELGRGREDAQLGPLVERYAREIQGHFDPRLYAFVTRVLPFALTALLNGTRTRDALFRLPELRSLSDRVCISGPLETIQKLTQLGTVVYAPTHVSNLDSVLFGYALFRSGLPPVAYGAGLNLFESRVLGRFMHNLGAYSVDRAKSDPLYRAVLKEYATVLLERGEHGLFFPGGTRSRSFALEQKLKKGLLGTTLVAYRNNLVARRANPKIFVVPATCSYPLVLEAQSLAEDFLLRAGRERYVHEDRDDTDQWDVWLGFLRKILALDAEVHVRFSTPLDPFGNEVDGDGISRDPRGRPIEPAGYLESHYARGTFPSDPARDAAYTEILEREVLAAYQRDNVVMPTWLLAYAALEQHRRDGAHTELFRMLRALVPGAALRLEPVRALFTEALRALTERAHKGEITLSPELRRGPDIAFERALQCFSTYHARPVLSRDEGALVVGDASLLFFYRNRLEGLGLLGAPGLLPTEGRS